MFRKTVLIAAMVGALSVVSVGPASAAWIPEWVFGCEGQVSDEGPSWDLGPECKTVEEPAKGVADAAFDYAYAQAYAACTFANGIDPDTLNLDCSDFDREDG